MEEAYIVLNSMDLGKKSNHLLFDPMQFAVSECTYYAIIDMGA